MAGEDQVEQLRLVGLRDPPAFHVDALEEGRVERLPLRRARLRVGIGARVELSLPLAGAIDEVALLGQSWAIRRCWQPARKSRR